MSVISTPLNFLRDYSIPIGEAEQWDRSRAATVPCFIVFAFFWLNGNMKKDDSASSEWQNKQFVIGLLCILPGAIVGTIIKLKTKVSEPP